MQVHAKKTFVQDSWQSPRNARTLAAYMALQDREIGERIASLRSAKGNPPQEIVAQRLDVSNRSYQSWEAGDTKPSWRNLTKLAKFYGVSEEYILLGDQHDEPEPERLSQLDRIEAKLDEIAALLRRARPGEDEPGAGLPRAPRGPELPLPGPAQQPSAPTRRRRRTG